jgi:hypothetical protein
MRRADVSIPKKWARAKSISCVDGSIVMRRISAPVSFMTRILCLGR